MLHNMSPSEAVALQGSSGRSEEFLRVRPLARSFWGSRRTVLCACTLVRDRFHDGKVGWYGPVSPHGGSWASLTGARARYPGIQS